MAFRIALVNSVERDEAKRKRYYQLNIEAVRLIQNNCGKQKWENDMAKKIKDERNAA